MNTRWNHEEQGFCYIIRCHGRDGYYWADDAERWHSGRKAGLQAAKVFASRLEAEAYLGYLRIKLERNGVFGTEAYPKSERAKVVRIKLKVRLRQGLELGSGRAILKAYDLGVQDGKEAAGGNGGLPRSAES